MILTQSQSSRSTYYKRINVYSKMWNLVKLFAQTWHHVSSPSSKFFSSLIFLVKKKYEKVFSLCETFFSFDQPNGGSKWCILLWLFWYKENRNIKVCFKDQVSWDKMLISKMFFLPKFFIEKVPCPIQFLFF